MRSVLATVWENIAVPLPENGRVAQRGRRVAEGVDHFLAISDRARLHLEIAGVAPERITVQPMGIDLGRFRPAERDGDARRPLELLCGPGSCPRRGSRTSSSPACCATAASAPARRSSAQARWPAG